MIPIIECTNDENEFMINCRHDDAILIHNKNYRGNVLDYLLTEQSHPHLDRGVMKNHNAFLKTFKEIIHNEIIEKLKEFNFVIVREQVYKWRKYIDETDTLPKTYDNEFDS